MFSPALGIAQTAFGLYAFDAHTWNDEIAKSFPLVIVQYQGWTENAAKIADIKKLASQGQRVLVDFEFLQTKEQRRGEEPMPSLEETFANASRMLDQLSGVALEGITIDEENIQRPDRRQRLAEVHRKLKSAYPSRTFLQWAGIGRTIEGARRIDWSAVPSDGWVIDPYSLSEGDYATYVQIMQGVTDRIYSVIWLAPGWEVGAGRRQAADPSWWNTDKWRIFYSRVAVNQANGVTSVFYMYALSDKVTSLWAGNDCDRAFHRAIIDVTMPYLKEHTLPRETPAKRPDWIPAYCSS